MTPYIILGDFNHRIRAPPMNDSCILANQKPFRRRLQIVDATLNRGFIQGILLQYKIIFVIGGMKTEDLHFTPSIT